MRGKHGPPSTGRDTPLCYFKREKRNHRLTAGVSNEGYSEQAIDYDPNGNIMHLARQTNWIPANVIKVRRRKDTD